MSFRSPSSSLRQRSINRVTVIARKPAPGGNGVRFAVLGAVVCVLGLGVGVWTIERAHRSADAPAPAAANPSSRGGVAVSEGGLSTLASLGRTIYWAGSMRDRVYELTQRP